MCDIIGKSLRLIFLKTACGNVPFEFALRISYFRLSISGVPLVRCKPDRIILFKYLRASAFILALIYKHIRQRRFCQFYPSIKLAFITDVSNQVSKIVRKYQSCLPMPFSLCQWDLVHFWVRWANFKGLLWLYTCMAAFVCCTGFISMDGRSIFYGYFLDLDGDVCLRLTEWKVP